MEEEKPFDASQGKQNQKEENKEKKGDCPLCQISEETIKKLKESANKKNKSQ